jgi:hypothetical protein
MYQLRAVAEVTDIPLQPLHGDLDDSIDEDLSVAVSPTASLRTKSYISRVI